jgi:hypothetical protein
MKIDAEFMYGVSDAVKKLRPGAQFELTNTQFTEWNDPNGTNPPSWEEIMAIVEEDKKIFDSLLYARERKLQYPKIQDQLDAIWHAVDSGIDLKNSEWFKEILEVKQKFPKP